LAVRVLSLDSTVEVSAPPQATAKRRSALRGRMQMLRFMPDSTVERWLRIA
jgi:hypothetical protein